MIRIGSLMAGFPIGSSCDLARSTIDPSKKGKEMINQMKGPINMKPVNEINIINSNDCSGLTLCQWSSDKYICI